MPETPARQGIFSSLGSLAALGTVLVDGCDVVVLDCQHGLWSRTNLPDAVQLARSAGVEVWVRVPSNDPAEIGFAQDCGAAKVVVPLIETSAEVERAVRATSYPPAGTRSFGSTAHIRATGPTSNTPVCVPLIETAAAVDNLEAILAQGGFSELIIGQVDLGLSLTGTIDPALKQQETWEAVQQIFSQARSHDVAVGITAMTDSDRQRFVDAGASLIMYGSDRSLLAQAAAAKFTIPG